MGERIEFECAECGEPDAIDSSSLNFITSISGLDRDEVLVCDAHLQEKLEGVTLDLSIGGSHTRSEEFQRKREERQQRRKENEMREVKDAVTIEVGGVFRSTEWDEYKAVIDAPTEAKTDIKALDFDVTKRKYDEGKQGWTVVVEAVPRVVRHLEGREWEVRVGREAIEVAEREGSDLDWPQSVLERNQWFEG